MVAVPLQQDPTLEAMRRECELKAAEEPRRRYIGASSIGDSCSRKLWYQFHGYPAATITWPGVFAIEDGHRSEEVVAARLRLVPGVELWTHMEDGCQWGFEDGPFKGHIDGVILGLIQAPVTPHVWENKATNEKSFAAFRKAKTTYGEKLALRHWKPIYWSQAQTYMKYFDLTRHYTTVCTPGARDIDSCRTDYDPVAAEALRMKAFRIAEAKEPPTRIGGPDWHECRFCAFHAECHGAA